MKYLLPLALMLVGCGGTVAPAPSPTVTPSPAAVAPAPTPMPMPTPSPTPTPTPAPAPQWQPPQGWELYETDKNQRLAIRQSENPSCGGIGYCADFEVMPSVSCRNGIYMEVQWIDSNTNAVEDWGNAYLPRLDAGQVGRLSTGIDWPPKSFTVAFTCHE